MSVLEEDSELKDLVSLTLENSGLLHNIRAQLKASVYLALEKHDKKTIPVVNSNMRKCLSTNEGCIMASVVRDFLTFHSMDFSISVFDSETCHSQVYESVERSKLAALLEVDVDPELPVLASLLRKVGLGSISIPTTPCSQNATFIRHNSTLNSTSVSDKSHSHENSKSAEASVSENMNQHHSTPIKESDEENVEKAATVASSALQEHQVRVEVHQMDEYNEDFSSAASVSQNDLPSEDNRPASDVKEGEIEEELEEISDLLQSSTSLDDDATRDQTASAISHVGDFAQSL